MHIKTAKGLANHRLAIPAKKICHLFLQRNFSNIHFKHDSCALLGSLFNTMNIMQLTLLVLLAGVGSVISGRLALPQLACCTSYNLDLGRVYIPLETDPNCRRIISEIPYSCPMGVLPERGNMKLREARSRGCKAR
ncbi:hypothetical protein PSHT_01187 [Puccinia striiformis]|uniref:Uncharacterized protein n=1 Tax=Puccinia striiformis TaxID=27350 RepID=A0A2S4WL75_9BASI|nr:hypothetical protein PSHT_01187 [Puccinia striiformis]